VENVHPDLDKLVKYNIRVNGFCASGQSDILHSLFQGWGMARKNCGAELVVGRSREEVGFGLGMLRRVVQWTRSLDD
jgi:hypothetical protein